MHRIAIALALLIAASPTGHAAPAHGIAMHGAPLYASDFKQFSYVNPDAPKGGRLILAAQGSFDSLNPLIIRGASAQGIRGYVYESLMARSLDEPFSLYGLIAETIETPEDRSWVAFTLRPEARFSDGKPITVEDVVFTHQLLRDRGRANHRTFYSKASKVEVIGERTVKFSFEGETDREIPLIMGLMPILPKHAIKPETFEQTTLDPPLGSGPYILAEVDPGRSVTYRRNPDYWGRDLAVNRGMNNFDEIRFDYYRDGNALFEGFKKGLNHVKYEFEPNKWQTAYDFPAATDGRVIKGEFDVQLPSGMAALVFNTRRPVFSDQRVRQALGLLFDFEWMNKNLYFGVYTRTQSFFDRSDLSSHGRPADARERELLAPFADAVQPDILEGKYTFPVSDGTGRNRSNLRKALSLLEEAGYVQRDGVLVDAKSGAPLTFEVLTVSRDQDKVLVNFQASLKRAGIDVDIRQVDTSAYQRRRNNYDFDMIQFTWSASLSPGNEQLFRWASDKADVEGTFNYAGVKSPAVDAMIQAMLAANSREDFVSAVRALDRVLLSGNYVIPLFHLKKQWVAYWSHLRHPEATSLFGFQLDTWWSDPAQSN